MRILIDDRRAVYAPRTGIGRFAGLIVRALEQHAPQVDLLRTTSLAGRFASSGIASSDWTRKFFADQLLIPLRTRDIDASHVLYYETSPAKRTPLVLNVYDLSIRNDRAHVSSAQRAYYGSLLPLLVRRAQVVIVPSAATRHDMAIAFPKATVKVLPCPVDPTFADRISAEEVRDVSRELGLLNQRFMLYTGGLHARKGIETLLAGVALAQARDRELGPLVVTGNSDRQLIDRSRAVGCSISCPGSVSDRLLRCLYEACAVVVSASAQEGFGYPAAEAAMLGKPMVCPDRGSLSETAGSVGVPFRTGDAAALADAIAWALEPDERTRRVWSQEPAHAVRRFSPVTAANELRSCYELAVN